ncbi:hypothetical protein [Saccharopolyspora terrae]|uniref:hypothetical protein n=1 Tax=Saccharopolyspora terrae TaxID=2530384 RepID=UPI001A9FB017|nr:hypothetical protein [Saccharopolyspora terrae]
MLSAVIFLPVGFGIGFLIAFLIFRKRPGQQGYPQQPQPWGQQQWSQQPQQQWGQTPSQQYPPPQGYGQYPQR